MWTFVVLSLIVVVNSHPQCLDFTFPFTPDSPLLLCSEYSSFGCCNHQSELQPITDLVRIFYQLRPEERNVCTHYVKTLLCQKCSPYAAHIYDAENLPKAKGFPGLCPSYCNAMISNCSGVMKYFIDDARILSLLDQRNYTAFCNSVTTIDRDYCYPDLKQNPDFSQDLGKVDYYQSGSECIAICLEEIDSGRSSPLSLKHARDGTHRMFVVEQLGVIWIYLPDQSRLEPPFLNIKDMVAVNERRYDERGMLDIEFHPNYRYNGRFYLYYTISRSYRNYVRISEMRVSDDDMNKANVSSERVLLEILQPAANHNGGQLLFKYGEVGNYLYIFSGDGGRAGDPFGRFGNGQNTRTLLGKVLRVNVDSTGNGKPYGIPPDNPFINNARYLPEIYALGVRNMWRCSSDRGDESGTDRGRIICGDVGQNRFEEIDIITKGGNYGWRAYEGHFCYDRAICNSRFVQNYIPPIHVYSHSVGKSVTGGYVYRGCHNPNLKGRYIFGDFQNGKIFSLTKLVNGNWKQTPICPAKAGSCLGNLQNFYAKHILSFGESENGEMYILSSGVPRPGSPTGRIYKIVDPSRGGDPSKCQDKILPTELSPGTRKIIHKKRRGN